MRGTCGFDHVTLAHEEQLNPSAPNQPHENLNATPVKKSRGIDYKDYIYIYIFRNATIPRVQKYRIKVPDRKGWAGDGKTRGGEKTPTIAIPCTNVGSEIEFLSVVK